MDIFAVYLSYYSLILVCYNIVSWQRLSGTPRTVGIVYTLMCALLSTCKIIYMTSSHVMYHTVANNRSHRGNIFWNDFQLVCVNCRCALIDGCEEKTLTYEKNSKSLRFSRTITNHLRMNYLQLMTNSRTGGKPNPYYPDQYYLILHFRLNPELINMLC